MLHKRFKPAKCKTSLKLATSRIKLMKNKKLVQINQMKKELAQLLETGQDRTARIRVEHVIREEKMIAAYELIEIYCELIVARLPIIESQKLCPIDLKEAVTSVIFAAPRCSDIAELADIRKHFTAKYGKDFVSGAIELRPDCGVSRMLVEKLSAVAPDIQTKVKVLSGVAKDHNVEWDATSFEEKESKPTNDLLNGPVNFEKASMIYTDPPIIQTSNIEHVHSREEKHGPAFDFTQQNKKYTSQNIASNDNGVEASSSGVASERMETRQPFYRGENDISSGGHNWNMEFKDATSAAQAAAESAERAAMAARAAAQFSSHEKISNHNIRDDESFHVSAPSKSTNEYHSEDSYDDRKPKIVNQRVDRSEHDTSSQKAPTSFRSNYRDEIPHVSTPSDSVDRNPKIEVDRSEPDDTFSQKASTSFKSNNDLIHDEKLDNNFDRYSEESLHEDEESYSGLKESKVEVDSGNNKESFESEDINYFAEEAIKKQPSIHSSHSHASISDDDFDDKKFSKKGVIGNPFAVVDQESQKDDDIDSDDDNGPKFDSGFDYDESLEETHIWSPRANKSSNKVNQVNSQSHLFKESVSFGDHSVKSSETGDHIAASFDHSDSDTESEKKDLFSTSYEPDFSSRKSRIELDDLVEKEESFHNPPGDEEKKPESHQLKKHNLDQESYDDNNTLEDEKDIDTRKELSFGTLTGGLRNKGGLKYPYLSNKSVDESYKVEDKKPSISSKSIVADSDADVSDKFALHSTEKTSKQDNTRLRFSPPPAFLKEDETDSEEEVPKQVPNSRVRLGSGLSRRTRGASSKSSHVDPKVKTVISTSSEETNEIPLRKTVEIPFEPKTKPEDVEPKIMQRESVSSRKNVEIKSAKTGESVVKKPSHVHPKLPDYDSLAARLRSLRNDDE